MEVNSVDFDEKVGDAAGVLLESVGTLFLDAVLVAIAFEFCEAGSHSLKSGVGGGKSHLLGGEGLLIVPRHTAEAELGVVGFVESHLGDFLCETESHFRG